VKHLPQASEAKFWLASLWGWSKWRWERGAAFQQLIVYRVRMTTPALAWGNHDLALPGSYILNVGKHDQQKQTKLPRANEPRSQARC
jgi:hypothetical protein